MSNIQLKYEVEGVLDENKFGFRNNMDSNKATFNNLGS